MPLTVKLELKPNYLYARFEGEFDIQSAIRTGGEILDACAQGQMFKILADYREATGDQTDAERIQFAQGVAEKYQALLEAKAISLCRFAFLAQPRHIHPKKLGEAVAVNRGIMIKVVDNVQEAFEWLGIKPDIE